MRHAGLQIEIKRMVAACAIVVVLLMAFFFTPVVEQSHLTPSAEFEESGRWSNVIILIRLRPKNDNGEQIFLGGNYSRSGKMTFSSAGNIIAFENPEDRIAYSFNTNSDEYLERLGIFEYQIVPVMENEQKVFLLKTELQGGKISSNVLKALLADPVPTDVILAIRIPQITVIQEQYPIAAHGKQFAIPNKDIITHVRNYRVTGRLNSENGVMVLDECFVQIRTLASYYGEPSEFGLNNAVQSDGLGSLNTVLAGFALTVAALFLERRGGNILSKSPTDRHLYRAANSLMIVSCGLGMLIAVAATIVGTADPQSVRGALVLLCLYRLSGVALILFIYAVYVGLMAGNVHEESGAGWYAFIVLLIGINVVDSHHIIVALRILLAPQHHIYASMILSGMLTLSSLSILGYIYLIKSHKQVYGRKYLRTKDRILDHPHRGVLRALWIDMMKGEDSDIASRNDPFWSNDTPRLSEGDSASPPEEMRKWWLTWLGFVGMLIVPVTYISTRKFSLSMNRILLPDFVACMIGSAIAYFTFNLITVVLRHYRNKYVSSYLGIRERRGLRERETSLNVAGVYQLSKEFNVRVKFAVFSFILPTVIAGAVASVYWHMDLDGHLITVAVSLLLMVSLNASIFLFLRIILGIGLPVVAEEELSITNCFSFRHGELVGIFWNTRDLDEGDQIYLFVSGPDGALPSRRKTFAEVMQDGSISIDDEALAIFERSWFGPDDVMFYKSESRNVDDAEFYDSLHDRAADPENWVPIGMFPYAIEDDIQSHGRVPEVVQDRGLVFERRGRYFEYDYVLFKCANNIKPMYYRIALYDEDAENAISGDVRVFPKEDTLEISS